jgi:hypothetical protein
MVSSAKDILLWRIVSLSDISLVPAKQQQVRCDEIVIPDLRFFICCIVFKCRINRIVNPEGDFVTAISDEPVSAI